MWICCALTLSLLHGVQPSLADDPSSNAVTDALIPWGDSTCVSNEDVLFSPWPEWMVSAFKIGGAWDTNMPAWIVEAGDTNVASLNIEVDRFRLTNNVLMQLDYVDHSNATMMLDLYAFPGTNEPNEPVFTSNLFNNLLSGNGGVTSRTFTIPFSLHTNAVGIRLRRDAGAMTIFDTLLSSDRDDDGYADSEELALGSDPDSALSVPCAAITGQVFYAGVQTGVIHVLATTNAADWVSAHYLTLGMPGIYTLAGLPLRKTWHPRAYRDVNDNGVADDWEPRGEYLTFGSTNPVSLVLTGNTGSINITMADPDSDGDGMSDAAERALGLDPYSSNSFTRLPFLEQFETDTVQVGDVNGQNGWIASPINTALVQTGVVWEGEQAVRYNSGYVTSQVRRLFAQLPDQISWVDFHAVAKVADIPQDMTNQAAAFLFDPQGRLVVQDGRKPAGQKWVTLTNVPPVKQESWVRLSISMDFAAQRWLICLNGMKVAEDLGFGIPASELHEFAMEGGSGGLDQFSVSTNVPAGLSLDGDTLPDDWERAQFGNLDQVNGGDLDQDGASNLEECLHGTDPNSPDTDNDGLPDGWELHNGFDPKHDIEANLDSDGDGLTNLQEYQLGTNHNSPDTDGDDMPDKWEVDHQLNPLVNDAAQDGDADGLANSVEFQKGADPQDPDSDGDGLLDGAEINTYKTNPNCVDSDGDGLPDAWEVTNGTAPDLADAAADMDGDGMSNMEEYLRGTPPANVTNALKRLTWSGVLATGTWTEASWLNSPPDYPGATEDACLVSNVLLVVNDSQKVNVLQVSKGEIQVGGTLAPYSVVLSNGVLSSSGTGLIESPNTNRTAGRFAFEMVAGTNSAVLTGAGASLRKSGSGSVLVTGLNYYSGRTQLDAGVLRAQDGAGLPSGSQLCFNGGILGATGLFSRTIGSSTGMVYWTGNGGFAALGGPLAVRLNGGAAIEWNSTNGFNGKLLYLGSTVADNLTDLQNPISLKGNYTVQVDDNTASTQDVARLSGPIDNGDATARGLNKTGAGILELTGTNTFSGTFTLSGGLLRAQDGRNIPGPSLLAINGGVMETLGTISRSVVNAAGGVYWSNNGGFAARGGALTLALASGQTLNWAALTNGFNARTLVFGSTTADDMTELPNSIELRGDRTVQVNDNPASPADLFRLSGPIANGDATPRKLTKTGSGVLQLTGTNSYSGATVLSAGTLCANDGQGLPGVSLLQFNGGVLESEGAFSRAITNTAASVYWSGNGGFAAKGGPLTVSLNSGMSINFGSTNDGFSGKTLFLGSATADSLVELTNPLMLFANRIIQVDDNPFASTDFARVSGVISNGDATARALSKYGKGLLELTATNTFTGNAYVNAGTLRISGSIASLATVYTNATLAGSGTVKGFNLANGAILAPGGDQAGTLWSSAAVTFGSNSVYQWKMGVTNHDVMVVSGNVTLARCRLQLREFGGCTEPDSRLTFLRYTGTVSSVTNFVIDTSLVEGLTNWDASGAMVVHDATAKRFYITGLRVTPLHDSDGDGMDDLWETQNGLDPADPADAQGDADGDGLTNLEEFHLRLLPGCVDSDNDGLADGWEVARGTDPAENDSQSDPDDDGLSNLLECQFGTWPLMADSDADGLNDGEEALIFKTDPLNVDSDGDETPDRVDLVTLNGVDTSSRTGQWATNGTAVVSLSSTNARLEYAVNVVQPDMYRLCVELDNNGSTLTTALVFRLQVLVDNLPCGWLRAVTWSNAVTRTGLALPWLTPGPHTLRLAWLDDKSTNKVLEVRQIVLQQVDGPDADQNSRQDGVDALLATGMDTDGDGLSDKDELDVYGTDPLRRDTDGDTLGDGEEVVLFGTNPLMASSGTNGVPDAVLVEEKNGVDSAKREQWHITCPWSEQGPVLVNPGASARVSYDFAVSNAAMYRFGVQLRNINDDPPDNYKFKVMVSVDGISNSVVEIFADMDLSGTGYVRTPWLTPGTHRITLQWLNDASALGRAATLGLEKILLYAVNAPDSDGNGFQDWMQATLESAADSDGDGLADNDEVRVYGTNPLSKDTDGDGLSDKDEITHGTNPNLTDTDSDGVLDGEEVWESLTDPLAAEFDGSVVDVDVVPGVQTNQAAGTWVAQGSGIESTSLRGCVDYVLNSPTGDVYRIKVNATHYFKNSSCSPVVPIGESDVQLYIDGRYLGKKHLVASDGIYDSVECFTPWLASGPHTVQVFWENVHTRLSVRIKDVRLQQLGGPDANGNGIKDWVEATVMAQSGWESPPAGSVVSPVCLEGKARFIDMMTLTSGGITGVVNNGVLGRWYADVPLATTGPTPITVSYQGGSVVRSNTVSWVALNLLSSGNMTIRKNDALKLTAFPEGETNGVVQVLVDGFTNAMTTVDEPVICVFTHGGKYTLTGIHDAEVCQTNSITVTVMDGAFPSEPPACMIGASRNWVCTNMPVDVALESDPSVTLNWTNQTATLRMSAINEDHYLVSRLYPNGPILASTRLDGFWVQGAVDTYVWVVERYPDSQVWANTMVTKRVPPTVSIQIHIFAAGVTFDDMTMDRWLLVQDLGATGDYTFRMIHPNSVTSSTCHTIKAYQGGEFIGEAYYGGILMPAE
jgi:autotransporter-associated beta strand protein